MAKNISHKENETQKLVITSPWTTLPAKKLNVPQQIEKFSLFIKSEGILPCSQ